MSISRKDIEVAAKHILEQHEMPWIDIHRIDIHPSRESMIEQELQEIEARLNVAMAQPDLTIKDYANEWDIRGLLQEVRRLREVVAQLHADEFERDHIETLHYLKVADQARADEREIILPTLRELYESCQLLMEWIGPPPKDQYSYDSLREDGWAKAKTAIEKVQKILSK